VSQGQSRRPQDVSRLRLRPDFAVNFVRAGPRL